MHRKLNQLSVLIVSCLFLIGMQTQASAQGKGHGQGGSPGGGPPSGVGVDRGIGMSSDRSNGRADNGRSNGSDRSNGRSDAALERRENAEEAEKELDEHPQMAARLHMNANDLRKGF